METLTYGSGRASGCDSPGLLNVGIQESGFWDRHRILAVGMLEDRHRILEFGVCPKP